MDIIRTIVTTLLNRFDCFIVIDGMTGIGKSTLAYQIAKGVNKEFKKLFNFDEEMISYYYEKINKKGNVTLEEFLTEIVNLKEKMAYSFRPRRDLVYSQREMLEFLSAWYRIAIPDEMINITFNRDFQHTEQKDIIKMLNMYRDHRNLIIACVPIFNTIDTQVKNLCKIRFTVIRRGYALIQTPVRTIHGRDKWDTATNESIEKAWLKKGSLNPVYTKMTTVRGIMRFPPLLKSTEKFYQKIKDDKRAIILRDEMGIKIIKEEKLTPVEIAVKELLDGNVKDGSVLDGMALANGETSINFKGKIKRQLDKMGKATSLQRYYYKKSAKEEEKKSWNDLIA